MIVPRNGYIIVELILRSEALADDVKKRSGLLLSKPTNSGSSFEGIPNRCRIVAVPDDYKGPVKVGKSYIMADKSPSGIKIDGKRIFWLEEKQIVAEVLDGS